MGGQLDQGGNDMETASDFFFQKGYLIIKELYDPKLLYDVVPTQRGQRNYHGSLEKFTDTEDERQVPGSFARYYYPPYKEHHSQVRLRLQKVLGTELYNTYYYDRFYFKDQELTRHTDRDSCEISVSIHISSNLNDYWPFKLITKDGEEISAELNPGDGLLYMGCDVTHWRDPLKSRFTKQESLIRKIRKLEDDTYYHQIFFHYVLANGYRAHFAYDRCS